MLDRRLIVSAAFAALVAGFLAGCLATFDQKATIDIQSWRQLHVGPSQHWVGPTTATYTYVLMGNVGDGSADTASPTGKAVAVLEKLLSSGIQDGANPGSLTSAERLQANQYCIPSVAQTDGLARVTLKTYEFGLARDYTNAIIVSLDAQKYGRMRESLSGTGPFLVTTWLPLGEIARDESGHLSAKPESALLLVDLSGVAPATAVDFVRAQQQAIRGNVSGGTREVRPFQAILASWITEFDKTIPLIAAAEASVLKQFTLSKATKDGAASSPQK